MVPSRLRVAATAFAWSTAFAVSGGVFAAGDSALSEAVKTADRQAVLTLLKKPGIVNTADADGTTPLHWAVRANQAETVDLLLRSGADANASNRYGMTPLMLAAVNGSAAMIDALLAAGADPNGALPRGETVLMTAARTGDEAAVRALIARGARVNAREEWQGESALMWAVAEEHPAAAKALIEGGADVNARSALTKYPKLDFGVSGIVPMSLPKGGFTPLMYAARQGALGSVQVLLEAGADVNATDPEGTSALILAIMNAHYDVAVRLLDYGADPEIADASGMAALYAIVDMHTLGWMQGRPAPKVTGTVTSLDVFRILLANGVDPNVRLRSPLLLRHHALGDPVLGAGATPIMRAAKTGDVSGTSLLLESGADPTVVQQNGTTLMMVAAGLGWRDGGGALPVYDRGSEADAIEIIKICLENGSDVNAANDAGDTALHGAALRGADTIVQFLVEHGARINAKNKQGRTPLDVAIRRQDRSPTTVTVLKALGGSPSQ